MAVLARYPWPFGHLVLWHGRLQARHRLRLLLETDCEDRLRDMGITRGQALREVRRPFWKSSEED